MTAVDSAMSVTSFSATHTPAKRDRAMPASP
jgi:hypothetical protein